MTKRTLFATMFKYRVIYSKLAVRNPRFLAVETQTPPEGISPVILFLSYFLYVIRSTNHNIDFDTRHIGVVLFHDVSVEFHSLKVLYCIILTLLKFFTLATS